MGSRYPSHRLGNGLVVSGRLEQPKEKAPTMSSAAMPYTGGDIKKSGELGKMFIPTEGSKSRKSGPITGPPSRTGSFAGAASHSGSMMSNAASRAGYTTSGPLSSGGLPGSASLKKSSSGPLNKHGEPIKKSSGPQSCGVTRQNSGSIPSALPATGLITSGPISSGPLNSSGAPRKVSGPLESTGSMKLNSSSISNNPAVTTLSQDDDYSVRRNFPKTVVWLVILIFVMGLLAGGFILGAVHNAILLLVVAVLFVVVAALVVWNMCRGSRSIIEFIGRYPDTDLRTAKNGQYVKVSGVVTCGNVPLESSFQRIPRCVYTSTRLYEYRAWGSKPANPNHRHFTWGLRSSETHVVDFYISDFQSGLRALIKTGSGTRVAPFVDDSFVVDINPGNKDLSPEFVRWLGKRNLSSDERLMRLKEGYIKEGSTVSVMGIVQRNENVLMIVPPPEPLATGWQWPRCIFPASLDGIVLRHEDTSDVDVIPDNIEQSESSEKDAENILKVETPLIVPHGSGTGGGTRAGLFRTPISGGVQSATSAHGLPRPALAVRNLMEQARFAHLCTVMSRMHHRREGYPFGSLVDFAPDPMGHPIFSFSPLAIHTRNLLVDPRCTLVVQIPGWSGLSNARVTIFGDVFPLPEHQQEWAHKQYIAKHQQGPTQQWGNFYYFRMQNISDIYFIGGFGTVAWVDVKEYEALQPDKIAVDGGEQNLKELNAIFSKLLKELLSSDTEVDDAAFISIDSKGTDIRVRQGAQFNIQRLSFEDGHAVETLEEAKAALWKLIDKGQVHSLQK